MNTLLAHRRPGLRCTKYALIRTVDEATASLAGGCGCVGESAVLARQTLALDPTPTPGAVTWSGVIGVEGELTGDGRFIEASALRWEDLPIPLRYAAVDMGGHDGAEVVGRILTITRGSDGLINATGDFDMDSPVGAEAARHVDKGLTQGISMDLDTVSFEVRVAKELLEGDGGFFGPMFAVEDDETATEPEVDSEGRVTVMEIKADDEVMVTTDARVRASTLVAIPAFARAKIALDAPLPAEGASATTGLMPDGETPCSCDEDSPDFDADCECEAPADAPPPPAANAAGVLVAGAGPVQPPAGWFSDPHLTGPSPLTITPEGRLYGHLAVWGTCHIAFTGQCVEPPHSPSAYAYFRTGSVLTSEGAEVATGAITLDTLHAGGALSAARAISHYEHTGRGVADVTAGEDAYGIWVAGALRPNVTEEQVRALRASPLSGDWRRLGGSLEMVAALAVNVPGFPIPRPKGLVASGVMTSLVASGMLAPRKVIAPGLPGSLTLDDLRYLQRLVVRERRADEEAAAGIASAADALAARLRSTRAAVLARRVGVG